MPTKRASHMLLLRPPPGAVEELVQVRDAARGGVPDPNLHLTFCWFGYEPAGGEHRLPVICAALDGLVAAPVRILLDELVAGPKSLLVRAAEPPPTLMALHRMVLARLAARGLRPGDGWRFAPHVTLRRGGGSGSALPFPIAWTADAVHLVRSEPWHVRHELLGTWPLC